MVTIAYVADYTIEHGLYAYAQEVRADLIGLTTHGRSGLAHFFRGSIGGDIVNHAPLPVITFTI
jgi:nucleotide-binding universal stress UspA family protein